MPKPKHNNIITNEQCVNNIFHILIIDCFITLLVGAKTFKTKTKDSTLNPVWNEVFEVLLLIVNIYYMAELVHAGLSLRFQVAGHMKLVGRVPISEACTDFSLRR